MCDIKAMSFELSQALDSPLELEETREFEPCCLNMTDVQDEVFRLDEGLDLVVSHDPKTMQCVATLLLAVNRMKKPLTRCRKLSDDELCSVIMDSLIEETIVKTTEDFSLGAKKKTFLRVNSGNICTLHDTDQKAIVHGSGEIKLQAITLKGGNCERTVNFKLARYMSTCDTQCQCVLLSITNNNLHLSCVMKDGKAVLNLEECSEETLKNISDDENMDRFLFYKRVTGVSLTTFESVRFPGWFISTSNDSEQQPVEMCVADAARRVTSFKVNATN
ncbi:interleukin-1 beta [Dicentrarchus labrax]|uniref:Interleukin-1 n=1 Tax=Dicentrarchus labrax TaxID=13489 RepID=A0A8C4DX71_DICLA|nr:interleukin-1 beta [Dicentrarchus labrax]